MIGGDGINDESNKTAPAPTRNTDLTKNRVRPPSCWPCRPSAAYFNPRTPVGCDTGRGGHLLQPAHISIHAPQWGATRNRETSAYPREISIHAPQWGATYALGVPFEHVVISIHAPQWGATCHSHLSAENIKHFNPRTPVGCDPPLLLSLPLPNDFNPRTPVGCDLSHWWGRQVAPLISIHAPQWGATAASLMVRAGANVFQSTHPSGVRQKENLYWGSTVQISIHAPQWGATRGLLVQLPLTSIISIHAPQWGATR